MLKLRALALRAVKFAVVSNVSKKEPCITCHAFLKSMKLLAANQKRVYT